MSAIQFTQIHPRAFAHPADRHATAAFAGLPIVPSLIKKVSQLGIEERYRALHMYNSVQLGPRQLPSLWNVVNEVAERLCIPPPRVYLSRGGEANAFAFGTQIHSIVLTTELVELASDHELRGIVAHEMGHILCEHMLYMGVGLALSSGILPSLTKLVPGLEESVASLFYAWRRAAEYSADRAALLILEDPEPLAACLSRLAGVPRRFEKDEFDVRLFVGQVEEYKEEATLWSKVVTFGMSAFLTHPEPAKRVGALLQWAESDEYRAIVGGRYLTRFEFEASQRVQIEGLRSCPLCRLPVGQAAVCANCGLSQDSRRQRSCEVGHLNDSRWRFCKTCGGKVNPDARHSENPGC